MHHPYLRPDLARSQSGLETPASMSFARLDEGSSSRDQLVSGPPKGDRKGKAPARESSSGDIAMQDLAPRRKSRRREHPVDPMLQALSKPAPQREGKAPVTGLEDIPLTPPGGNSRRTSTDEVGIPLPGHGGPGFRDQVMHEEAGVQSKNKKAAIAAGVTLMGATAAGIIVSTLKNQGKI
jgi:hypothetical protein